MTLLCSSSYEYPQGHSDRSKCTRCQQPPDNSTIGLDGRQQVTGGIQETFKPDESRRAVEGAKRSSSERRYSEHTTNMGR